MMMQVSNAETSYTDCLTVKIYNLIARKPKKTGTKIEKKTDVDQTSEQNGPNSYNRFEAANVHRGAQRIQAEASTAL